MAADAQLDTSQIKTWRSIITLIVFVLTSEFLASGREMFRDHSNLTPSIRPSCSLSIPHHYSHSSKTCQLFSGHVGCVAYNIAKADSFQGRS